MASDSSWIVPALTATAVRISSSPSSIDAVRVLDEAIGIEDGGVVRAQLEEQVP